MEATIQAGVSAAAYAAVGAVVPEVQSPPRRVEPPGKRGDAGYEQHEDGGQRDPPVLQLIQRSADLFASIAERTANAQTAAQVSGVSLLSHEPGYLIDRYA